MKIYTRGGDDGQTGLLGGTRVPKDHPRVEACGAVDELAATLGWARTCALSPAVDEVVAAVLATLHSVAAELACPAERTRGFGAVPVGPAEVAWVERTIDAHEAALEPLRSFVLPGGSAGAAALHLARTVCRRAERRVVTVGRSEPVRRELVEYLNRVSDLCVVLARRSNQLAGVPDLPWGPRGGAVG